MKKGVVIPAEGEPYSLLLPENPLPIYQKIVGGWIELVPNPQGVTVYCNEEGKIHGLPPNHRATALFGEWLHSWDVIAGSVIVVGPPDEEGYDTDLVDPESWVARAKGVNLV